MKKRLAAVLGAVLVAVTASSALASGYDQAGYGRLQFGMTAQEVARFYQVKQVNPRLALLAPMIEWMGVRWLQLAYFQDGRLKAVELVTKFDKAHFIQVAKKTMQDLGRPLLKNNVLVWIQSRRLILLTWKKANNKPYTIMRFAPRPVGVSPPQPQPQPQPAPVTRGPGNPALPQYPGFGAGLRPSSGSLDAAVSAPAAGYASLLSHRAVGAYQVCYRTGRCRRFVTAGRGKTRGQATSVCSVNMTRQMVLSRAGLTESNVKSARIVQACRVSGR
jgi:hypothetical protein